MYTPRQAAEKLGIRLDYCYRLITNGGIPAARINGQWFVSRDAVDAHLAKSRVRKYRARLLAVMGA